MKRFPMPTGLCAAIPLLGLLAVILPVASEEYEEERPLASTVESRGLSLMQSGRSVMPTIDTKLMDLDYNDGLVDEFAKMEDEYDDVDDTVEAPTTTVDFKEALAEDEAIAISEHEALRKALAFEATTEEDKVIHKDISFDVQQKEKASILDHIGSPCLYVETILVIIVFALSARGFKLVKSKYARARVETSAAPVTTTKVASTEAGHIFIQGGSKNFPALEQAVRAQDEEKCLELLKQGGRWAVRQEDPCGCTALHVAAHCGSASMATLLLNHGAKVDACEAWEETPLHIAARSGSLEVCEILLDHGANIDMVNAHGKTALLLAGDAKQEAICELLLSRGAGAGGMADDELPPLVNALLVKRMFAGAVPRTVPEVHSDDSEEAAGTMDFEE